MDDFDDGTKVPGSEATCTVEVGPEDREAFIGYHADHAAYLANDIRRMRRFWAIALGALALVYLPVSTRGALVVLVLAGIVVGAYGRLNRWWYVRHNRRLQSEGGDGSRREMTLSLVGGRLSIHEADRCSTLPVSAVRSIEEGPAHFFVYVAPAEALIVPRTSSSTSFVQSLREAWTRPTGIDRRTPTTTDDPSHGSRP